MILSNQHIENCAQQKLVKVRNDIMVHLDQGNRVALLLLDMSAAFDTLDHSTLLNRFNEEFGIIGKPLKWFESYFGERTQSVVIRGVKSEPVPLSQGVPQGSVIGPKAYTMYTKSLGDIIEHHGLQYHIYADDIQIYIDGHESKPAISILSIVEKS